MSRREDVDNAVWSDTDFFRCTPEAKLLYLWSFTNPRCGMAGIYKVPLEVVALETGLAERTDTAMDELVAADFLAYEDEVLFVRSRVKHLRTRTPNVATSIGNDVQAINPAHSLRRRFLEMHPETGWLGEVLAGLKRESAEVHEKADKQRESSTLEGTSNEVPGKGKGRARVKAIEEPQTDVARELFDYWRERCNHPGAHWTPARQKHVKARLSEGYSPEQIRQGIDGGALNPPKSDDGHVVHDDLVSICRNGDQLERYIARATIRSSLNGAKTNLHHEKKSCPFSECDGLGWVWTDEAEAKMAKCRCKSEVAA